jgi:hypothetical protein
LDANLCLFLDNHAKYFGSFYHMTRLNSPDVISSAAKRGSVEMRYTVLEDSTTRAHNGGFWTRMLESMKIRRCLFAHCKNTSDQQDTV